MATKQNRQVGFGAMIATLGGLATLIAGCLTICGLIGFNTQIFARPTETPVPAQMSGQLLDFNNEYDKTFGNWLAIHGYSSNDYTVDEINEMGMIVSFKVRLVGFTGVWCHVQWSQYNADNQQFVSQSPESHWHLLQAEANEDQSNSDIWVAYPQQEGNYTVRIELFCPNRQSKEMKIDYGETNYSVHYR